MNNRIKLLPLVVLTLLLPAGAASQDIVKDSLEFARAMATTPAATLQGRVAGLGVVPVDGNVNGAVNTLIRGVNSLRSDSQPIWVVDGTVINADLNKNKNAFFQYGEKSYTAPLNALSFLDCYDIEEIRVLKDLSQTVAYGLKGGNGVIEIRTKLPSDERFRLRWRSNVGLSFAAEDVDGTRNAISHNHHLTMSGASGQTRYFVSASLRDMEGIAPGNGGLYGGLRANFETKANQLVWFGMNSSVTIGQMHSVAGTSYFGQPSLTMTMRKGGFFPADTFAGWASDYDDEATDKRFVTSMYLRLNFTRSLTLNNTFGVDFENNNRYIWYGNGTTFGLENNGAASILGTSIFKYNASSSLDWNKYLFTHHHLMVSAAVEASGEWTKFNTLNGTDFFLHGLRARGLNNAASKATLHKYDHEYGTVGAKGQLSYSWKGIVEAGGTVRLDRTPRYDDKAILFKAGQLRTNVLKAVPALRKAFSSFSLEAGYGEAGREQYVPYGLYGEFLTGSYPRIDPAFQMFYEGLNRARSAEISAGVGLGLASDRVLLHMGYYDKRTTDAFYAYCFGTESEKNSHYWKYGPRKDVFSRSTLLANRGIEGELRVIPLNNGKMNLTMFANAAWNINQLLRVDRADADGMAVGDGVIVNANVEGMPAGSFYSYRLGPDGLFMDLAPDGKIDIYDKDIAGNPNPKLTGAAGAVFSLSGFRMEVLFTGAAGFDILNLNRLLFEETEPYDVYDSFIERGDYLRLSRIGLSYRIPGRKIRGINGLEISLSALNLLTFTSYSGWDPEVNCFGTSCLSAGVDYGSYPASRSVSAGLSIIF